MRLIFAVTACIFFISGCDSTNDAEILATFPGNGSCSIDNPERNSVVNSTEELRIRGWAYHKRLNNVPQTLTLYFINDESHRIQVTPLNRGERRGDVAKAFGNPELEASGFSGAVAAGFLSPGKYKLILMQADNNIDAIRCDGEPHYISVH